MSDEKSRLDICADMLYLDSHNLMLMLILTFNFLIFLLKYSFVILSAMVYNINNIMYAILSV